MTTPTPSLPIATDADWTALKTFFFGGATLTVSNKIDFLNALTEMRGQKLAEDQLAFDRECEADRRETDGGTLFILRQLLAVRTNEVEELRLANNLTIGLRGREVAVEEKGAGIAPGPAPGQIPPPLPSA